MGSVRRILCLANSQKQRGRCVAGREILASGPGPWIRPVSFRRHQEVSYDEQECIDGTDSNVMDVIDIPLLERRPDGCQTENWLLDPDRCWRRVRMSDWSELKSYVENPPTLWINGRSTAAGTNDEIPLAAADELPGSLYLIRVSGMEMRVLSQRKASGEARRRLQGRFQHAGINHALWVTDPRVEQTFLARADGDYAIGECCLTISLSNPFPESGDQYRYKLIAAVIERGRWT